MDSVYTRDMIVSSSNTVLERLVNGSFVKKLYTYYRSFICAQLIALEESFAQIRVSIVKSVEFKAWNLMLGI